MISYTFIIILTVIVVIRSSCGETKCERSLKNCGINYPTGLGNYILVKQYSEEANNADQLRKHLKKDFVGDKELDAEELGYINKFIEDVNAQDFPCSINNPETYCTEEVKKSKHDELDIKMDQIMDHLLDNLLTGYEIGIIVVDVDDVNKTIKKCMNSIIKYRLKYKKDGFNFNQQFSKDNVYTNIKVTIDIMDYDQTLKLNELSAALLKKKDVKGDPQKPHTKLKMNEYVSGLYEYYEKIVNEQQQKFNKFGVSEFCENINNLEEYPDA